MSRCSLIMLSVSLVHVAGFHQEWSLLTPVWARSLIASPRDVLEPAGAERGFSRTQAELGLLGLTFGTQVVDISVTLWLCSCVILCFSLHMVGNGCLVTGNQPQISGEIFSSSWVRCPSLGSQLFGARPWGQMWRRSTGGCVCLVVRFPFPKSSFRLFLWLQAVHTSYFLTPWPSVARGYARGVIHCLEIVILPALSNQYM